MSAQNRLAVEELKSLGFPIVNIRRAMPKLTGTSQQRVADKIGLSRVSIGKYLDGRRNKEAVKVKIAEYWDVPVKELFPDCDSKKE